MAPYTTLPNSISVYVFKTTTKGFTDKEMSAMCPDAGNEMNWSH